MSITVKSSPASQAAGQSDMWVVVDASEKAQTNYKYILDLLINSSIVATAKCRPYLANSNYGIYDIGKFIREYFGFSYFKPGSSLNCGTISGHKVSYALNFSESYTSGSTTVSNVNVVTGTTQTAYNSRIPLEKLPYKTMAGYLNDFITNRPTEINIDSDENYFFCVFADTSSYDTVEIKKYDRGGSLLATDTTAVSGDVMLNLGASAVSATGSTYYYTARLKRSGSYVGSTLTFTLNACTKYTKRNIHFMNQMGGFDSVPFRLVSKKKREHDKRFFEGQNISLDASGNVVYYDSYKVYGEAKKRYGSKYSDKITVNSDLLTDAEYEWLAELFDSPQIFIEESINGVTYYLPAVITQTSYEFKRKENDKTKNLEIELEYSVNQNGMYR